jgi:hypothetical protein
MGTYTWDEFKKGFNDLGVNTVEELKKKLP